MTRKMLIDATHAEETRVVVVDGHKVDEFDFESLNKRQLAGNIYLAKVTRVEPSLQAAFVDYGGNRHGFLAFSEIHPDYYQIPKADREALIAEEAALSREAEEETPREKPKSRARSRRRAQPAAEGLGGDDAVVTSEPLPTEAEADDGAERTGGTEEAAGEPEGGEPIAAEAGDPFASAVSSTGQAEAAPGDASPDETPDTEAVATGEIEAAGQPLDDAPPPNTASGEVDIRVVPEPEGTPDLVPVETPRDDEAEQPKSRRKSRAKARDTEEDDEAEDSEYESVGGDDISDERPQRKQVRQRRYKIQEVIKVRQILLVQVVKEERGNKGAALTTYLSLAGRYCVLMPNTARGGGISRKITNAADRKKLKEISNSITVPEGAGLIIRTAGANRTKTEIRRDYEYLLRQWEQIRDLTLKSIAPAPIYEEGSLIKRAIRDLYSRDIDEVLVDGERGYREAKDYMKMLMPSHAKNVRHYNEALPLFSRFQVENYLSAMFNPVVQLKSGGYIVIDVTEALVAIDVNSGRATREASIEETALKTNLEAAEEAARQMRLRDLAGLIVIDFIDMEDRRNNAAVEKRLKEKLKSDRARIQVGRISGFGLLEMSRQRLRPGMIEATTKPCAHCHGTGRVRSDDSLALALLREVEEEGVRQRSKEVLIVAPVEIANYLLNQKREHIALVESRFGLSVRVEGDPTLISPDFKLERFKTASRLVPAPTALVLPPVAYPDDDLVEEEAEQETEAAENGAAEGNGDPSGDKQGKRKRRRRRRGGRGPEDQARDAQPVEDVREVEASTSLPADVMEPVEDGVEGIVAEPQPDAEPAAAEAKPAPRARSRRRSRGGAAETQPVSEGLGEVIDLGEGTSPGIVEVPETAAAPASRKRERVRRPAAAAPEPAGVAEVTAESGSAEDGPTEASTSGETLFAPEPEPPAAEVVDSADATGLPPAAEETIQDGIAEGTGIGDTGVADTGAGDTGAEVTASGEASSEAVAPTEAPEPAAEEPGDPIGTDVPASERSAADEDGNGAPASEAPPAAPDFEPEAAVPDLAGFESPMEAPVPFDVPYEAPYETLTAETPPEDPIPGAPESAVSSGSETPEDDHMAEPTPGPSSASGSESVVAEPAPEQALEPDLAAAEGTDDTIPSVASGAASDAADDPAETGAGGAATEDGEAPREYETAIATEADAEAEDGEPAPKRRGWWSRG